MKRADRRALQTTGTFLVVASLAVFFGDPSEAGSVCVPIMGAGLILAWLCEREL